MFRVGVGYETNENETPVKPKGTLKGDLEVKQEATRACVHCTAPAMPIRRADFLSAMRSQRSYSGSSLPHTPFDTRRYEPLLRAASQLAGRDDLLVLTSGDSATRKLVLNFYEHASRLRFHRVLVLCWTGALAQELSARGIAAYNSSADLANWSQSKHVLSHVQRVFLERLSATTALVANGTDVLLADADCIFLRDFRQLFRSLPQASILAQPDNCKRYGI